MMTTEEITRRIERIRETAHDAEAAHSLEDELYFDLLCAIAEGRCTDPAACCKLAITADDIEFARWKA